MIDGSKYKNQSHIQFLEIDWATNLGYVNNVIYGRLMDWKSDDKESWIKIKRIGGKYLDGQLETISISGK